MKKILNITLCLSLIVSLFSCGAKVPDTYDESKIVDETFTMIVQVNGKVRGKIEVASETTEDEMKKLALEIDNVKTFTEGKEIVKTIVVPNKIVNIVVK